MNDAVRHGVPATRRALCRLSPGTTASRQNLAQLGRVWVAPLSVATTEKDK
jgi:hypothetical protein